MNSDSTRHPNGDLEGRVVRIEASSAHQSDTFREFRDETRRNFDRVHAEFSAIRGEIRILTGMLFTVVMGVFAILAKVYGI